MNKQAASDVATVTDIAPTPYIAVAANFYGTGANAKAARQALVKAGGSPQEDQTVFKLPEGAQGAYVSSRGHIHWRGTNSGEATPVYRYLGGKSVEIIAKPQPWKSSGGAKGKQPADAQKLGEVHPEPELKGDGSDDPGAATVEETTTVAKPKRIRHKPGSLPTFVVGDKVRWESGPMAKRVTKTGEVTHVIPAGQTPPAGLVRDREGAGGRTVESYIVKATDGKSFWPHTSALSKLDAQPTVEQIAAGESVTDGVTEPNTLAACADIILGDRVQNVNTATGEVAEEPSEVAEEPKPQTELPLLHYHATDEEHVAIGGVLDKPAEDEESKHDPTIDEQVRAALGTKSNAELTADLNANIAAAAARAEEPKPAAKPKKDKVTKPDAAKELKQPKPAKTSEPKPAEVAHFLVFVGGSFYSKDEFIAESGKLGISRRMPSHRLPKGLVSGKSRVYVATSGARKFEGEPEGEVFGYFTPDRVEFIATEGEAAHADVIASLKLRPDTRIVSTIAGESERECGTRVEGGTYIVVDKGDSPLVQLDKSAKYVGNHFRGLLKLTEGQVKAFNEGGTVATLIDETCMTCGAAMKCAPDGHARATRERKRIDKGLEPKWRLNCTKCQAQVRADRRAAQEAEGEGVDAVESDDPMGMDEAIHEAVDDASDGDEGQPEE